MTPTSTQTGGPLADVGVAIRTRRDDGGETWRVPASHVAVARRLARLGARGVGGFVLASEDADGATLVRALPGATLSARFDERPGPWPWAEAVTLALAIVDALAACEEESLFPGPIGPRAIATAGDPPRAILLSDALVAGMLGAAPGASGGTPEGGVGRWIAPEQAAGAPWDNAANRYVLGLLLYRMLAGEHPFAGRGLRHAIEESASRGAPPLAESIASTLPPGLQSLCLRLLDPDPSHRPLRARDVAERLHAAASNGSAVPVPVPVPVPVHATVTVLAPPQLPRPARKTTAPSFARLAIALAPLALGGALAFALSSEVDPAPPPIRPKIADTSPLSATDLRADDCATCHPRQSAEWHASVMAHAAKSPLYQALEILIQEQVGRDFTCPDGAGILRESDGRTACRDRNSGLPVTGSGGELWCVNCHVPGENLRATLPAWDGLAARSGSRAPLRDLLPPEHLDGISCAFCHEVHGPVRPGNLGAGFYEGNPFWVSTQTGERFAMRPEDGRGVFGIANSGYTLDAAELLAAVGGAGRQVPGGAHVRPTDDARAYLRSSEFCGACHDVRLFGTDVLGARKGEHFKRLRNAYSEWAAWAGTERAAGRQPASCQDCHMSAFPGVCVPGEDGSAALSGHTALARGCPDGTHFERRAPGTKVRAVAAVDSASETWASTHYFSGVDVPLTPEFTGAFIDDLALDAEGIPRGAEARRDLLLGATFRFELDAPRRFGDTLEIPVVVENVGAGHRVPAGFSQEREFWVHLRVTDAEGRTLYEVGRVDRNDEDLHDKIFERVTTDDGIRDQEGRPLGLFGADVIDGPDLPRWSPSPNTGATSFRGLGLVNLQNGFLRCVTCIGRIAPDGTCEPLPGQERRRADRFDDGAYDIDTGECRSNLFGEAALFETYFPIGALDSTRGIAKGPDAIIDTRSAAPGVPLRYTYELPTRGRGGPFTVEARLLFRAFPPFLVRAFADYEARMTARGQRPSGPLVTPDMLERLEVVELHRATVVIP